MKKLSEHAWMIAALSAVCLATIDCSKATEYCDAMCECELCNDRKYDECIIEKEADYDRADAYECSEEYEEKMECYIDRKDCDDNNWKLDGDDCSDEIKDYSDCKEDSSKLIGKTSTGTGYNTYTYTGTGNGI